MYDDARDMYELEYPAPDMGSKSGDRPTLVVALNGYAGLVSLITNFERY